MTVYKKKAKDNVVTDTDKLILIGDVILAQAPLIADEKVKLWDLNRNYLGKLSRYTVFSQSNFVDYVS